MSRGEYVMNAILGVYSVEAISESVDSINFCLLEFLSAEKGLIEGVIT